MVEDSEAIAVIPNALEEQALLYGAEENDLPDVWETVRQLGEAFGQSFLILDAATGAVKRAPADCLNCELYARLTLCEEIARRGKPEVLEECGPLLMLAIPLVVEEEPTGLLAVSTFLTEDVTDVSQIAPAAHAVGVDADQAFRWSQRREIWPPRAVLQLAQALAENAGQQQRITSLKSQITDVSSHLLNTFEELSLLHRLTERLTLSGSETELSEMAVQWLTDVVPAECVAMLLQFEDHDPESPADKGIAEVITCGSCPVDDDEFERFLERLGPDASSECLVLNRDRTNSPTWYYPSVRELVSVPIRSADKKLGWLLAFNYKRQESGESEFGTVEASLLCSVAAILGVHAGNIDLYREQAAFFASVVRALSSAIDAKDPYTCGHSDRVARLSVCLARQLGCDTEELNAIYLSGLLHDIGKIGIDDTVLRKPGKLTKEEYEHIKSHPELGHKILDGVKQLDKILPVVLHHHEAWDGGGYPAGLKGQQCPRLARIVAVADSIDAMGSDRPYRKGMSDEKLDQILREGAGKQWDAEVVDAVFAVREEIRLIGASDRASLDLDVGRWNA